MQSPWSPSRLDPSSPTPNSKQFPNIQFRKLSLHTTDHPKYLIKFSKSISNQSNTQPLAISSLDKTPPTLPLSLPKENGLVKKRIFIAQGKQSKEKVQELLENELVRRQIEELQSQGGSREQLVFNCALKDFGLIGGQDFPGTFKTNSNAKQYQGYRKRNTEKKDKLKPIISETHINNGMHGLEFFNVGKMNLLDGDRHKKSTSLLARSFGEEESEGNIRFLKEINSIKERIVGKKGLPLQLQSHEHIKMQTLSPSQRFFQSEHSVQIPRLDSENRARKVLSKGQTVLHIERRTPTDKELPSPSPSPQKQHHPIIRHNKKFTIPFQTYHYRDLIWKVNYSNQRIVEIPLEYEHRIKVFVGRGNNSCMVSGLITRRPWYAFTDRPEEANFVWTQLKQLSFLKRQEPFKGEVGMQQREKGKYKSQSILTDLDCQHFKAYFKAHFSSEERNDERLASRLKYLKYRQTVKAMQLSQQRVHNHLINNYILGNKKALFNTMSNYYKEIKEDVFRYLPLTFHIKDGLQDKKYFQFLKYYHKRAKEIARSSQEKGRVKEYNAWIVKPGENSNRGNGIKMCLTLQQIKAILKKRQKYPDGSYRTFIVQSYIERPLLYYRRKFDLRHYIMMTSVNGLIKGYWYKHGYVRTTSNEYTLTQNAGSIHLTNDAVQKNLPDYGKYEKGNKISYEELSAYIQKLYPKGQRSFDNYIYPRMKKIATDAMRASSGGIDPSKLQNNFEIFGMDFMIDCNLEVWLIEINTNPCLQLSCPLLGCIIPKMIENALQLTLDAFFPPPARFCPKGMHYYKELEKENRFELVYDQRLEQPYAGALDVLDSKLLEQQDDTFQDCGEQWQDK